MNNTQNEIGAKATGQFNTISHPPTEVQVKTERNVTPERINPVTT